MAAFDDAFNRAAGGIAWSYPCLIWLADYLHSATGRDPAAEWRTIQWNEATAKHQLLMLSLKGEGNSRVERALGHIAQREGWQETDEVRQGAIMVGVFDDPDGEGVPAIFDGWKGWLCAGLGCATILYDRPVRMWEVRR